MLDWLDFRDAAQGGSRTARFSWEDTERVLAELGEVGRLAPLSDASGFSFEGVLEGGVEGEGGSGRVELPQVLPEPDSAVGAALYLAALPDELGRHLVVHLRAGAAALGLWEGGHLVLHKVSRKYVVRGAGRAQPAHLRTKGKSRYGSRLRLRNARSLQDEVCERLGAWRDEIGEPDRCFYTAPVRLWAELFRATSPPPFARERFERIPGDSGAPAFEELERLYRQLCTGRLTLAQASPGAG